MTKRVFFLILAAFVAGLGAAVAGALALAVVDIYLAGHGRATLGRTWIDRPFVHMSRADCILVAVAGASAVVAGWTMRRVTRTRTL